MEDAEEENHCARRGRMRLHVCGRCVGEHLDDAGQCHGRRSAGRGQRQRLQQFQHHYTVTLTDLTANPTSVAQALSGLSITFQNTVVPIAPFYQGDTVTLGANGAATFNPGAIYGEYLNVPSPWVMTSNKSFTAAIVSASAPAYGLIGPPGPDGTYSNANGSIAGNDAHNPFTTSLVWSFELTAFDMADQIADDF
jgi:hypothetical protein